MTYIYVLIKNKNKNTFLNLKYPLSIQFRFIKELQKYFICMDNAVVYLKSIIICSVRMFEMYFALKFD